MNYQDHNRYRRRHNNSDRAIRAMGSFPVAWNEERPHGLKFDELLQWEIDHGSARYQDHNRYDGPGRAGRAMNFNPGDSYSRELRPWLGDLEDCQWEPNRRSWR